MPNAEVLRYVGNGVANRTVGGFVRGIDPKLCLIYTEEPLSPLRRSAIRISTMPDTFCSNVSTGLPPIANRLQRMTIGSIDISTNAGLGGANDENINALNIPYNAIVLGGPNITVGTYAGNGVSPRTIGGLTFTPDWVMVAIRSGVAGNAPQWWHDRWNVYAADRRSTHVAEGSLLGIAADNIRGSDTNAFIVGAGIASNGIGETYDWCAMKKDAAFSNARYVGNGVSGRVMLATELSGSPIWVMTIGEFGLGITEVRSSSSMETPLPNSSRAWQNQDQSSEGIQILGPGAQFTIGGGTRVNANANNLTWMAFSAQDVSVRASGKLRRRMGGNPFLIR